MLNDCVYFVSLIIKESIDDIIFIDNQFNIEGMSLKLMRILGIESKTLFQQQEIPFYVICRKFLNFYNIFLQGRKKVLDTGMIDKSEILKYENTIREDENVSFEQENNNNNVNNGNGKSKREREIEKENERAKDNLFHENVEISKNIE